MIQSGQQINQLMQVMMLIAPEFDETAVVTTACRLRDEGLAVRLVGLQSGLVTGLHGITLRPDYSLAQYLAGAASKTTDALVLSGGVSCASLLLSDPRVHQLMQSIQNQGGMLAVMVGAQRMLAGVGSLPMNSSPNILKQNDMSTQEFVRQIVNKIL